MSCIINISNNFKDNLLKQVKRNTAQQLIDRIKTKLSITDFDKCNFRINEDTLNLNYIVINDKIKDIIKEVING